MSTPDALDALLARHLPVIRYDSLEPYFCDSAAEWTDNPTNVLRRADGTVIAAARPSSGQRTLSLAFLGRQRYADGTPVQAGDLIADTAHDYVAQARTIHAEPGYADRIYGHAATGSDGRAWLAYWFFYFYNDYNLVGDLFPAGLHEGDWEMIQLRLDPAGGAPDLAVYAQHRHADSRDWAEVERVGDRPVVYSARGSHASYFTAGIHWTGDWFDHADGHRPAPPMALEILTDDGWALWPGLWGDTLPKPGVGEDLGFDDSSPRGPGGHAQWRDPVALLSTVRHPPAAPSATAHAVLSAPVITVTRAGTALRISYAASDPDVRALMVAVAEPDDEHPPRTVRVAVAAGEGTVDLEAGLRAGQAYEISVASATADGRSSPATRVALPGRDTAPPPPGRSPCT
jgi:hypothetical protein